MARLTDREQLQLIEATRKNRPAPAPRPRPMTPKEYMEFAAFAARFARGAKPVRFIGDKWRL
jgi:hypothetical protein